MLIYDFYEFFNFIKMVNFWGFLPDGGNIKPLQPFLQFSGSFCSHVHHICTRAIKTVFSAASVLALIIQNILNFSDGSKI